MPTTPQLIEAKRNDFIASKPDYSFINWVRLVGMFTVVMVHCMIYPTVDVDPSMARPLHSLQQYQVVAYSFFYQFLRSGSILFFIVSGFLVGKNITTQTSATYFLRRVNTVAIPYIIAFSLYWLKSMIYTTSNTAVYTSDDFIKLAIFKANVFLFGSAYWFVPNYFFGLALLLIFRKYLAEWRFGILWMIISFLYGMNLHFRIVHFNTSTSFLSFSFFLWLGAYLGQRPASLNFLLGISNAWWLLLTACLYIVAYYEGAVLFQDGFSDPYNSLRISNQLFAVTLFILLAKNNFSKGLRWLNPRQESFGIYLYHMFFVVLFVRSGQYISWWPFRYQAEHSGVTLVGLSILQGLLVYTITLLFVKAVASSRLRWFIGLQSSPK